jgi:peptidoglycan/LPS O-acetylase OafA/YrhL
VRGSSAATGAGAQHGLSTSPSWARSGRIPSLDGLRAFAIVCVIFSHLALRFGPAASLGHFGVTGFFVISGFLITLLLIREESRTGSISIAQFYKRRGLRILPAYVVFLAIIAILAWAGKYTISQRSWVGVLTYTSCYMTMSMSNVLAHTWSLSVEEHFYVFWPLIFKLCKRRTAVVMLSLCTAVSPLIRWFSLTPGLHGKGWIDPDYSPFSQMSSIAVGCLLALSVTNGITFRWKMPAAAVLVAIPFALRVDPQLRQAVADTCRAAGFGMAMLAILDLTPADRVFRLFNSKLLSWIGVLSYSLYLWQEPFTLESVKPWIGLPLLAAAAGASYFFVERPFLALKDRIRPEHESLPRAVLRP